MQIEPARNWFPPPLKPISNTSAIASGSSAAAKPQGAAGEPVMAVVSADWSLKAAADYVAYLSMSPLSQSPAAVLQNPKALDGDLPASVLGKIAKEAEQAYTAAAGLTKDAGSKSAVVFPGAAGSNKAADEAVMPDVSFNEAAETTALGEIEEIKECQTCKNRMYVDNSSDPSVSFQSPANIRPEEALARVAAHEGEHVANDRMQAKQDGGRVVSQTVTLRTSICPECGRVYISGGETRTTVAVPAAEQSDPDLQYNPGRS